MDSIRGGTMVPRSHAHYRPVLEPRRPARAPCLDACYVAGCAELARPSEAAAPPAEQPPKRPWPPSISPRRCGTARPLRDRTYALFMQNDVVVEGRYAVQSDSCAAQSYTSFDIVTGVPDCA